MKKLAFQNDQLIQLEEVSKIISLNGYQFDMYDDFWVLNRESKIRIGSALSKYEPSLAEEIRAGLVYFAENKSPGYVSYLCETLIKYTKVTGVCNF
ncbi:hypothetical protein [Photobacterium leiognathi]|uniref:hypothetical protein n=1 Tax=Photobacterium leiognathi TaxID=553611 RepID=UPI00298206AE|nr:hypothetical protein [Photobacterium leiognathi]